MLLAVWILVRLGTGGDAGKAGEDGRARLGENNEIYGKAWGGSGRMRDVCIRCCRFGGEEK